jgi:hypothetical protein
MQKYMSMKMQHKIPAYLIDEIDINQYQSIFINRLILEIDELSMASFAVTFID